MGKSQETIPEGSRPKRAEAGGALMSNVKGDDIVQSMPKGIAVKFTLNAYGVANCMEYKRKTMSISKDTHLMS